jgi:hypothetical protein
MYSSYTAVAIDVWEARCAIWGDRHADVARGGGGLTKRSALGGRQIFVGCCCERTSASPTQLRTVNRNVISLWLRRVGRCLLLLISGLVRWPARPEDDGARARLHLGFSSQPRSMPCIRSNTCLETTRSPALCLLSDGYTILSTQDSCLARTHDIHHIGVAQSRHTHAIEVLGTTLESKSHNVKIGRDMICRRWSSEYTTVYVAHGA